MKKTKIVAPILGTIGAVGALIPLTSLVSCGKTQTNAIYLGTGQKGDRTVAYDTKSVTYRFVQKNLVSPEDTRISIVNFKVNGVYHSVWSRTFTYRTDSAGNITLNINTAAIKSSMSNDVTDISFNLLFRNSTANTRYYIGTFHVTFSEEAKINVELGSSVASSLNITTKVLHPIDTVAPVQMTVTPDTGKYVKSITLATKSGKRLELGKDYSFCVIGEPEAGAEATYIFDVYNCTEDVEIIAVEQSETKPICGVQVTGEDDSKVTVDQNVGTAGGVLRFHENEDGTTTVWSFVDWTIPENWNSPVLTITDLNKPTAAEHPTASNYDGDNHCWLVNYSTSNRGPYLMTITAQTDDGETMSYSFVLDPALGQELSDLVTEYQNYQDASADDEGEEEEGWGEGEEGYAEEGAAAA